MAGLSRGQKLVALAMKRNATEADQSLNRPQKWDFCILWMIKISLEEIIWCLIQDKGEIL